MELTNHAKIRYAERLAGRDTTIDINTYVAQNQPKIEEDLLKMYDRSELIFSGIVGTNKKDPVNVRLTGTWCMILNDTDEVLITIYKIDFGVGEDFNKSFIERCMAKLKEDKAALKEAERAAREEVKVYKETIKDNEDLINEYKSMINNLESLNRDYKDVIANKHAEYSGLVAAVRSDVECLIGRKEF